jgi:hypothetical protein
MKKKHLIKTPAIIWMLSLFFLTTVLQAQHLENSSTNLPDDNYKLYSKKYKKQKTTAWILLGGGTVLTVGGVIAQAATATMDLVTIMVGSEPEEFNQTGTYVAYAGLATMATSIPFFIASGKNKKRANIALQQQKITMGNKMNQQAGYQSISLRIRLGK